MVRAQSFHRRTRLAAKPHAGKHIVHFALARISVSTALLPHLWRLAWRPLADTESESLLLEFVCSTLFSGRAMPSSA